MDTMSSVIKDQVVSNQGSLRERGTLSLRALCLIKIIQYDAIPITQVVHSLNGSELVNITDDIVSNDDGVGITGITEWTSEVSIILRPHLRLIYRDPAWPPRSPGLGTIEHYIALYKELRTGRRNAVATEAMNYIVDYLEVMTRGRETKGLDVIRFSHQL